METIIVQDADSAILDVLTEALTIEGFQVCQVASITCRVDHVNCIGRGGMCSRYTGNARAGGSIFIAYIQNYTAIVKCRILTISDFFAG